MKQQIIQLLHERQDFVSSQELCQEFNVSRTAVWKVINQLKEDGYEIESVTRKGYRLVEAPDAMTADEIKAALKKLGAENSSQTEEFLTEIFYHDSIDSTNIEAARLSEQGYGTGTLVVSDEQTAGKGRRGRSWISGAGKGIYMTLLLKPQIDPNHASMLTLVAALAARNAIEQTVGASASGNTTQQPDNALTEENQRPLIKWPNDIVINGHKVVGILTEMNAQIDYINHIVIGIGINVHGTDFPEEIRQTAGSIYSETGVKVKRAELIARFLQQFEKNYREFLKTEDLSAIVDEYNEALVNKEREVRVLDPRGEFSGVAQGITEAGELLVETEGEVKRISSGEVSVRGIYGYV